MFLLSIYILASEMIWREMNYDIASSKGFLKPPEALNRVKNGSKEVMTIDINLWCSYLKYKNETHV